MAKCKIKRKRHAKSILKLTDLEQSKSAVLNSLTSSSSQRTYDHAIREFIDWYCSEPRLAFNKTVVTRYRIEDALSERLTPAFVGFGEILLVHETAVVFDEDGVSIGECPAFESRSQFFEGHRLKFCDVRVADFPVVAASGTGKLGCRRPAQMAGTRRVKKSRRRSIW